MPGNYTHTTRAPGIILTASIYNSDHQNHVDNTTPDGVDDASLDVTAFRSTVDPGEAGTESLPTSLRGELQRLRHLVREISGKAQWYETPIDTVSNLDSRLDAIETGQPRVLAADASLVTVVNTVTETDLFSVIVLGGQVSEGDRLHIEVHGDFLNNTGSNQFITFKLKVGASVLMTFGFFAVSGIGSSAVDRTFRVVGDLFVRAGTTSHNVAGFWSFGPSDGNASEAVSDDTVFAGAPAFTADFAQNQTIAVTGKFETASANLRMRKYAAQIHRL